MASIQDRRKEGRGWQVRYRDPDGKQGSRSFAKWADADTFASSVETDKQRGGYQDPRAGRVLLMDWAADSLAMTAPTLKPSTVASYRSLLDSRILPTLGRKQLCNLRHSDVQAYIAEITADGLSSSRVRRSPSSCGWSWRRRCATASFGPIL
jgi:hypothetical protein